ncbi:MAG TPA: GTPase-associated system all-helical protein GASH [Allosphingosinicella sp.]|jgi:hypothetical protein
MHPDFPKLYAEISTDGAERELRWAGIEAFAEGSSKHKVEVLARLAFRTKPPAGGHQDAELGRALTAFHTALSDADPSIEHGARQDEILAAGALLKFMEVRSLPALAVTTTACGGARNAPLPIDLVTSAENTLSRLAAARRMRADLSKIKIEAPEFTFEPDFAEAAANQPTSFSGVFEQFREIVDEALAQLAGSFNDSVEKLLDANKKADEELDLLAWVFGGHTLGSKEAFENVSAERKPLEFARDLASLTTIYPGPNSIPALLARAGVEAGGDLGIADAVNAVTDDWTAATLKDRTPSPATSPIHYALSRRQETGAGDGWQAGWAAVSGLGVATALPPRTLAELFYRETLWLR